MLLFSFQAVAESCYYGTEIPLPCMLNKKNWTLFSVASVLEVKINSIVFRLARHLCSSTSLVYWRASVASETLTVVTQSKIGDVCLFRYMYGRMYVILYFDPRVFVLVRLSTPVPNCTKQNPLVYRSVPVSP